MTTINPPAIMAGSYRVGEKGGWLPANSPQSLRDQVHDNLRRLGLDVLDVVNLRTSQGRRPRDAFGLFARLPPIA